MAHILIQKAARIVSSVMQASDVQMLEWKRPQFVLMERIAILRVPWIVYSVRLVIGEAEYSFIGTFVSHIISLI